ncbi:MAG: DUF424 family protein [Candidatus Hodarchaeales archaeon]
MSQSNNTKLKEIKSKRVFFKIHRQEKNEILAICDEHIMGEELFSDEIRIKVPTKFYKGNEIEKEEALNLIKNYRNINIFGSVIDLGLEREVIREEAVIWLQNKNGERIPHLLIFAMPSL